MYKEKDKGRGMCEGEEARGMKNDSVKTVMRKAGERRHE